MMILIYKVTNIFLSFLVSLYGAVFSTSGGEIGIFVQCTMGDFNTRKKSAHKIIIYIEFGNLKKNGSLRI